MAGRRPKVAIRRATTDDAEAFCAVFAQPRAMAGTLQLPYPSAELWRKRIADLPSDDFVLAAEVDGEVVGNAGLHASGRGRRRHVANIGMSVRDDWQGRGIGTALLAALIDVADNWLNYHRLRLEVYTDNAAAIALYRKFGFEVEGTLREDAFRDGRYVDAYTMGRLRPGASAPVAAAAASGAKAAKRTADGGAAPQVHRKATKTARKRRSS
jgi:L-phenylalanine/L-methionine N-acetyltransferase